MVLVHTRRKVEKAVEKKKALIFQMDDPPVIVCQVMMILQAKRNKALPWTSGVQSQTAQTTFQSGVAIEEFSEILEKNLVGKESETWAHNDHHPKCRISREH
jgi:hypothetical protein